MIDSAKLFRSLATALLLSSSLMAQPPEGDPFGGAPAGDPFQAGGAAAGDAMDADVAAGAAGNQPAAQVSEDDSNPLVRLLRTNPPKTPAEFAETLQWMVRIGRWDEISRYITILQKANWNQNQLAELSMAGGADLWFKLRDAGTELTDAQREFIRSVAALPAKMSRDPQWLDGWIARLASKSPADRREAQLRIMRGGRAAVERLCLHLMSGHPRVPGHCWSMRLPNSAPMVSKLCELPA